MKCGINLKHLQRYIDGESRTAREREAVEEHLSACGECRRRLATMRRVSDLMSRCAIPVPALSEEPSPALLRAIRLEWQARQSGHEQGRWTSFPRLIPAAASFAAAVLIAATALMLRINGDNMLTGYLLHGLNDADMICLSPGYPCGPRQDGQ